CRAGDYELLRIDKQDVNGTCYIPTLFGRLHTIIKFFHEYGGPRAERIAEYNLQYSETPIFVVQAYIAEFFTEDESGREIIVAVDDVLAKRYKGKDHDVVWSRFFTKSASAFDSYADVRGALQAIDSMASTGNRAPNEGSLLERAPACFLQRSN
ncbi:hypothetical protein PAPHI01_2417, partial [Pancytospora philotis]